MKVALNIKFRQVCLQSESSVVWIILLIPWGVSDIQIHLQHLHQNKIYWMRRGCVLLVFFVILSYSNIFTFPPVWINLKFLVFAFVDGFLHYLLRNRAG